MSWFNRDKPYTGDGKNKPADRSLPAKVVLKWTLADGKPHKPKFKTYEGDASKLPRNHN